MTTGEPSSGSSREDELLSRLYQQVTEQQATRFGSGYDIAAGLDRYRTWLRDHAAQDHARPEASRASTVKALQVSGAGTGAVSAAPDPGQTVTADPATSRPAGIRGQIRGAGAGRGQIPGAGAGQDADRTVAALYSAHYRSLVRLAALLVRDISTAEEVVQDSFIALHAAWPRLKDTDRALAYLRVSVVNRSRSVLRHQLVVDKLAPRTVPDIPGPEQEQITLLDRSAVVSALRMLPPRQREVVVLRYYAGLSEVQIAATMGISRGAVKSHTSRAMSSLREELRRMDE